MFLFLVYHWLLVGQILDTQNPRNSAEFRGPSQFNDFKLRFGLHTHSRDLVDASIHLLAPASPCQISLLLMSP